MIGGLVSWMNPTQSMRALRNQGLASVARVIAAIAFGDAPL